MVHGYLNKLCWKIVNIFIGLFLFFGCWEKNTINSISEIKFVNDNEINDKNFQQFWEGYSFNIKFKNVWIEDYKVKGRYVKVPIFQGISGDVKLSQLEKKKKAKENITILGALRYPTRKGEVKKTILECVQFYKDSLLKNIDYNKPTIIGGEETAIIIWYDFIYDGRQSSMMIITGRALKCKKCIYRYIDDIEVDEESDSFILKLRIGSPSPFYNDREEIEKQWEEYIKKQQKNQ